MMMLRVCVEEVTLLAFVCSLLWWMLMMIAEGRMRQVSLWDFVVDYSMHLEYLMAVEQVLTEEKIVQGEEEIHLERAVEQAMMEAVLGIHLERVEIEVDEWSLLLR
jgi:hypothetical protein